VSELASLLNLASTVAEDIARQVIEMKGVRITLDSISIGKNHMSDKTEPMICESHEGGYATFVCQHLVTGSGLGFFCADEPDDERPDAWCGDCDRILEEEGEWNDTSEAYAQVTVLCSGCYDVVRQRNEVTK
jgi:hypothetical protein